ncbi:MAG TPA: HAD family hydrolase [Steroidobacteraceae bacterium]
MRIAADTVFLLDVDNTLLDNDRLINDLMGHLAASLGIACRDRYRAILEQLRAELGYVDYLGALQRFRLTDMDNPRLIMISRFLIDYPFASLLYPNAIEVIGHLKTLGPTVILSDGDVVFQPRKIEVSGLWQAVSGQVLIYVHKEQMLAAVEQHYPARHYVMVDDKLRILAAMKSIWRDRLTTVFARQGHYALDPQIAASYRHADLTIEHIGDLLGQDFSALIPAIQYAR